MCDYSLMGVPNRLANEGEELLVHRFRTGSIGLTGSRIPSPLTYPSRAPTGGFWTAIKKLFLDEEGEQAVAVCIPPGARLLVRDIPQNLRCLYDAGPAEEVTFTQLSAAENTHRDAIRLNNGVEILLQRLREGQRVRVLELSLHEREVAPGPRMARVR
jgi:hypothetical protein